MADGDSDSSQEKTVDPSPGRLEKARRDGDVAQSKELTAALSYLAFFLCAVFMSGTIARGLLEGSHILFQDPLHAANLFFGASSESAATQLVEAMILSGAAWLIIAPSFGAVISIVIQRAIVFAPKKLTPKFSRISIIENAKKKFGLEGLTEFAKSLFKLVAVCICFVFIFSASINYLLHQSLYSAYSLPIQMLRQSTLFLGFIVLFSLCVAAIDWPWDAISIFKTTPHNT